MALLLNAKIVKFAKFQLFCYFIVTLFFDGTNVLRNLFTVFEKKTLFSQINDYVVE